MKVKNYLYRCCKLKKINCFYSTSTDEPSAKEKTVLSKECQLVTLMDVVEGKLEITTTHVYFYDKSSALEEGNVLDSET